MRARTISWRRHFAAATPAALCSLLAVAAFAACDSGPSGPPVVVSVTPATITLSVGATHVFAAAVSNITNTAVTWSVSEADGGTISATGVYVAPATPGIYHVRAASAARPASFTIATVTVVAAPAIASFTAAPLVIGVGGASSLLASYSGGVGYLSPGQVPITSGVALATGALNLSTQYLLVVKNEAGDSVTASLTVTVVTAAPVISSFSAQRPLITIGENAVFTWSITGAASISIDNGIGVVTTDSATHQPSVATTYTLTATNLIGSSTARTTVTLTYDIPTIASFTASPIALRAGDSTQLRAVYSGGTAVIDHAIGPVESGATSAYRIVNATTTYTVRVTNVAGTVATRTVTVTTVLGYYVTTYGLTTPRQLHETVLMANTLVLAIGGTTPTSASAETYEWFNDNWTATNGPMTEARHLAKAVLLADGRVLITGGIGASGAVLASAETYNPATRVFTPTDSMIAARRSHAMHLLDDGRVLIVGGASTSGSPVASAEVFDPNLGTFTTTGSALTARMDAQLFPLSGGQVVMVGGGALSFEIYNAQLGTFGPTGGTISANNLGAVRLRDGSILVVGSHRWMNGVATPVAMPIRARTGAAVSILPSGEVLVAADSGVVGARGRSESEIYNPVTDTYRFTSRTLESREGARPQIIATGNVVLIGGFGHGPLGGVLKSADIFVNGPLDMTAPSPAVALSAPGSVGAGGSVAVSVTATAGARYVWQVSGGAITSGLGTRTIQVTAGSAGTLTVRVLVVSDIGIPAAGSRSVVVTP